MKIYIAGRITGDPFYKEKFTEAERTLTRGGNVILNPAVLPAGLTNGEYMSICKAMIDAADQIALLPDHYLSGGVRVEMEYADYIGKPVKKLSTDGALKDA